MDSNHDEALFDQKGQTIGSNVSALASSLCWSRIQLAKA
jgi:hypothetical protein